MDGNTKYSMHLDSETRARLESLSRNGSAPAKKILHARVLLMSDQHHESGRCHDQEISAALGVHINTVARIRKLFVLGGEEPALQRKQRLTPPVPPKLDGAAEAALIAVCCSAPPAGQVRWTLKLLQGELVGRKIVTSISRECIRMRLKKTCLPRGASSDSAFPSVTRPGLSRRWSKCSTSMRGPKTMTNR